MKRCNSAGSRDAAVCSVCDAGGFLPVWIYSRQREVALGEVEALGMERELRCSVFTE